MMSYLSMAVKVIIAIPKIKELFEQLVDLYYDYKIGELNEQRTDNNQRRNALVSAISKAETREDRKELSILLHYHFVGKLPDE